MTSTSGLTATCALAAMVALASPVIALAGADGSKSPPAYPHYRMIVLEPLGGVDSFPVFPTVPMNESGQVIYQAATNKPNPNSYIDVDPGFYSRAILTDASGIIRVLSTLPGANTSLPFVITSSGLITGFSTNGLIDPLTGSPQIRAVLWDQAHRIRDLGTLGGYASAVGFVNDRGHVVGSALNSVPEDPAIASYFLGGLDAAQQSRAFIWRGGTMLDLGTLGGNDAAATYISEDDMVVGFSSTDREIHDATSLPTTHPFIWRNGHMQDLGSLGGSLSLPGTFFSLFGPFGRIANRRGQVVGTSYLAGDASWHAFLWSDGHMADLGTLGGANSEAMSINDLGQVVGRARVTDSPVVRHPVLWENGHIVDLGILAPCASGTGKSINNRGQIVGSVTLCTGTQSVRGFYVEEGKPLVNINTLIVGPRSGVYVDNAEFINDRGEIYGEGVTADGAVRAVLLVPVDE